MKSSDIRCNDDGTLVGTVPDDPVSEFWQQWHSLQDQLYRCCLKLMNFNPTDAEDALSQAMLKAWEKVQKYAGKIDNLKAWLMQLTRNFCIDIIRQRSKEAAGVESLEWVGVTDNVDTTSAVDTPEKALEKAEKATVIEQAIASLPERLRDTFILHFYQQRTHTEIAQAQGITYDNVCKRISLARKQLKEKLSSYYHGVDGDDAQPKPVEKADAGQGVFAVYQNDTDAIAFTEASVEEKSQGAIVNPNPQEKTDEENQQKTESVAEAIIFSEVSVVETSAAGPISPGESSVQEKKSQEAIAKRCCQQIASFDGSAVEKKRKGAIAKRCCQQITLNDFLGVESVGRGAIANGNQLEKTLDHVGIIDAIKNFDPSPRHRVLASALTMILQPDRIVDGAQLWSEKVRKAIAIGAIALSTLGMRIISADFCCSKSITRKSQ